MTKFFSLVATLIYLICYSQDNYKLFKNGEKYGLELNGKQILSPIYDSIINKDFIIAIKDKQKFMFDKDGKILLNIIVAENYENGISQKIDHSGKMIITKGIRIITPNEFPVDKNEKSEVLARKNTDYKIDKYQIKKSKVFYHSMEEPKPIIKTFGFKVDFPKNTKEQKFINNEKELEIESYYNSGDIEFSEEIYYEPLKISYIILKKNQKHGVWDFKEEKIILPFDYKKIVSHQNYLQLEKNGLSTFYPNIGTEPKYKKLEPYIGYFARFETVDGRKGWVDRKGKEYFDE